MGRRPLWAARAPVAVPACGVPEARGGRPAPLVAVLGGGQLGRMLALAGIPLGLGFRFLDPSPDATAGALGLLVVGALGDETALAHVSEGAAVVTYEWEGVPAAGARFVAATGTAVLPPPVALEVTQDRLREKELCRRLGIGTPEFAVVDDRADLERAVKEVGLPAVLKTRRGGYDGKGQRALREPHDVERAWSELGGVPLVLESLVPFDRELSVLAVRGRDGATACWPLVENHHEGGILRRSYAPAPVLTAQLQGAGVPCRLRLGVTEEDVGLVGARVEIAAAALVVEAPGDGAAMLGIGEIVGAPAALEEDQAAVRPLGQHQRDGRRRPGRARGKGLVRLPVG